MNTARLEAKVRAANRNYWRFYGRRWHNRCPELKWSRKLCDAMDRLDAASPEAAKRTALALPRWGNPPNVRNLPAAQNP